VLFKTWQGRRRTVQQQDHGVLHPGVFDACVPADGVASSGLSAPDQVAHAETWFICCYREGVMSTASRFVLTMLLALLLPLQGFAAASMMACAQPQHPAMTGDVPSAAHPSDAFVHDDHCAPASGDSAASTAHSCSACAACCVAGALTSSAPPPFPDGYLCERPPGVRAPSLAFITEGTDRPPRLIRA
jgi:hypothetical protein